MAGRKLPPTSGDVYRMNLSRVHWRLDVAPDGRGYVKRTEAADKDLAEDCWAWSPRGVLNMHKPESYLMEMVSGSISH